VPRPKTPATAALPETSPEITPAIPPRPWSSKVKWAVSAALLFHLTAQLLATWTAAPPSSELGQSLTEPFHFYIAAARLNQGYRFFAPNPEASHLLRFRIYDASGKPVVLDQFAINPEKTEGQLPPRELRVGLLEPQARLLYHRYFMLTEQLDAAVPRPLPPNAPAEAVAANARREQAFLALTDSFSRELLRRFGGASVKLQLMEHNIPSTAEIAGGMKLDDVKLEMFHPRTFEYPRTEGSSGTRR
jgi:hypothetical protein